MIKNLKFNFIIAALLFLSFLGFGCQASGQETSKKENVNIQSKDSGFVAIFDGQTLDGWKGKADYWRVENGVIVGEETEKTASKLKNNTFLIWQGGVPSDFVLKAEYKISANGNSGVQYRSEKVKGVPFGLRGYQFDIDSRNRYTGQNYEERGRTILAWPGQKVVLPEVSGAVSQYIERNTWVPSIVKDTLIARDSLKSIIKKGWNKIRIVAKGNHLQHYINGVLVVDIIDNDVENRSSKGLIGLQLHAGHVMWVKFRNIKMKKL